MANVSNSANLPDTYYRVSVKALVFDAESRLLVFMDKNHEWEMLGGGWEHGETFEACLTRELAEEVHVIVTDVSRVEFCYRGTTASGKPKLCIAAKVTLGSLHIQPDGDELAEASFVTREEFLKLPFQPGEASIQAHAAQIWPDN